MRDKILYLSRMFVVAVVATLIVCAPAAAFAQGITILGPPAPEAPAVFAKDDQGRITLRATRATLNIDGDLNAEV